jgi:hypothetical protein
MAMKKTAPKKKAKANGSDRGAQMKANEAQKKSQNKAATKSSYSPLNMTNAQQKAFGYKASNDLAGTYGASGLGARGGFVGRGSQRYIDQAKRADKKAADKKAQSRRVNRAEGASRAKVARGKK